MYRTRPREHAQNKWPCDLPIGFAKALRQQMDLCRRRGKDNQQNGVVRSQQPGRQQNDRHVRAESKRAANKESHEMRREDTHHGPQGNISKGNKLKRQRVLPRNARSIVGYSSR